MALNAVKRSRRDYKIGWICAIDPELDAARAALDEVHPKLPAVQDDDNNYLFGRIGDHNIVITSLPSSTYGTISATNCANDMKRSFGNLRFGLMVGVGGGVPKLTDDPETTEDIRLGDVVVSDPYGTSPGVIQYDLGKTKEGERWPQRTGTLNKPPRILRNAVAHLKSKYRTEPKSHSNQTEAIAKKNPNLMPQFAYQGEENDMLFKAGYSHREANKTCEGCDPTQRESRPRRLNHDAAIHYGTIASGNKVVKDSVMRDYLRDKDSVLCIEMEAAGLMDDFPCLVIRGICDYADSHKNKRWQPYAAIAAAAYAKDLLLEIAPEEAQHNREYSRDIEDQDLRVSPTVIRGKIIPGIAAENIAPDAGKDPTRETFLGTLEYRVMNEREDSISNAHPRTFEWLLMDAQAEEGRAVVEESYQKERRELRASLKEKLKAIGAEQDQIKRVLPSETGCRDIALALQGFLKSDSKIFWVWGKPGCGKSTLMKALIQNRKLRTRKDELLNKWSRGKKWLEATFFFSGTGTDLQKSHIGFLQSLIRQLLVQRPTLIDRAFSKKAQKEAVARAENLTGTDETPWLLHELKTALTKLLRAPGLKFYLHIDGLDEMDGSPEAKADIVSDIGLNANVKIFVAGRYEPEFETSFGRSNSMGLHKTTKLDILHYAVDRLSRPDMLNLLETSANFMQVLRIIKEAAEGVFLWVRIVIESLLKGCCHVENFSQLLSRLTEYPKDLDPLYWFLFEQIGSRYNATAAFWLLAVHAYQKESRDRLTLWQLELAEMFDTHDPDSMSRMILAARAHWRNKNVLITSMRAKMLGKLSIDYKELLSTENLERTSESSERATKMIGRMRAQCPHFFDFLPTDNDDMQVTFLHWTVRDFLMKEVVAEDLKARLLDNSDPHQAVHAATCAELLTDPEPFDFFRWEVFCRKIRKTFGWGHSSDWNAMETQFFNCLSRSTATSTYPEERISGFLTPTIDGWYLDDCCSKLTRMAKGLEPLRVLFALTDHGETARAELLDDEKFSLDQKLNLFLNYNSTLMVVVEPRTKGVRISNNPLSLSMTQGFQLLLERTSMELDTTKVWPRLLEYFRFLLHADLSVMVAGDFYKDPWPSLAGIYSLAEVLVRNGADPNANCLPIWADPEKSLKSALTIFKDIMIRFRPEQSQDFLDKDVELVERRLRNHNEKIITLLQEAGGREHTTAPEAHQEEEVKILNISAESQQILREMVLV